MAAAALRVSVQIPGQKEYIESFTSYEDAKPWYNRAVRDCPWALDLLNEKKWDEGWEHRDRVLVIQVPPGIKDLKLEEVIKDDAVHWYLEWAASFSTHFTVRPRIQCPKPYPELELAEMAVHLLSARSSSGDLKFSASMPAKCYVTTDEGHDRPLQDGVLEVEVRWTANDVEVSRRVSLPIDTKIRPSNEYTVQQRLGGERLAAGRCCFLVVGRQHHGKSTLCNHFLRFFSELEKPDEALVSGASLAEMTIEARKYCIRSEVTLELFDTPAFHQMGEKEQQQLKGLLQYAEDGWQREGLWPSLAAAWSCFRGAVPDAIIVAVSLESLRNEADALKDYLMNLAKVLKEKKFPYVVVATNKDTFQHTVGHEGKDPQKELGEAVQKLKELAQTDYVYPLASYRKPDGEERWWSVSENKMTARLLSQAMAFRGRASASHAKDSNAAVAAPTSVLVLAAAAVLFRVFLK